VSGPRILGRQATAPHVCRACVRPLVQPETVEPRGQDWFVVLRCPNCGWTAGEVIDQQAADRFDQELERGTQQLFELLTLVTERNMRDYAQRFIGALRADAILPEDF
jgi:RNase P subunit RPR2